MVRLIERRFRARTPVETAFAHLARVERWPSWARHIRRVELFPPGDLTPASRGVIRLTNGVTSTFRMVALEPPAGWKWRGPFLWLTVHFDHRFRPVDEGETEIAFLVDAEGFGEAVLGRVFAAVYARSLDRAIPRLVAELEAG